MFTASGLTNSHIAVACTSRCLRHIKESTSLIPRKGSLNAWVPFVTIYRYQSVKPQRMHNFRAQYERALILVAEARLWYRLMLKHSRTIALKARIRIMMSPGWRVAYLLREQLQNEDARATETFQHIMTLPGNSLVLSGLFNEHDNILSRVECCFWES